jgi:hypothetical protein
MSMFDPVLERVYVECPWCTEVFHEGEGVLGEDGSELFCSSDCRRELERDRAVSRAESRNDLD